MRLKQKTLDEYTVFLSKYGKYIVDEIAHSISMESLLKNLEEELQSTAEHTISSQDSEKERRRIMEENAFEYEMQVEQEEQQLDEDDLAACLEDADIDIED